MVLAWTEPPPPKRNPTVDALIERRGEWAHVGTAESVAVAKERARALKAAGRREGVKIETDIRGGRHARIWARVMP